MSSSISLLLIIAFATYTCALGKNDCSETLVCPPDAPVICIFHSDSYCFVKYQNQCAWNEMRCKYNLKFEVYAPEFCELENFACPAPKTKN